MSDGLEMRALDGTPGELAAQAVTAGCDLALHCTGALADSEAVLAAVPPASGQTLARMAAGLGRAAAARHVLDVPALAAERDRLLP